MAILRGKFLSGILGNLIIRKRKGQTVVVQQMEPGTMKQTSATKKAGKTFGMASALARSIRDPTFATLNNLFDGGMINRLTTGVYSILIATRDKYTMIYDFKEDSFAPLAGFEFNNASTVLKNLGAIPTVILKDKKLFVQLPEVGVSANLKFPPGANQCRIAVTVITIKLEEGIWGCLPQIQTIDINKDDPQIFPAPLQFQVPAGCLCVVYTLLHYQARTPSGLVTVNHKTFSPACICDIVFTSDTYPPINKKLGRCLNTEFILQKDQLQ